MKDQSVLVHGKGNKSRTLYLSSFVNEAVCKWKNRAFYTAWFKKTFATTLLEVGGDQIAVNRLMGHSSLNTTIIYDRRGDKTQKKAINMLPY